MILIRILFFIPMTISSLIFQGTGCTTFLPGQCNNLYIGEYVLRVEFWYEGSMVKEIE